MAPNNVPTDHVFDGSQRSKRRSALAKTIQDERPAKIVKSEPEPSPFPGSAINESQPKRLSPDSPDGEPPCKKAVLVDRTVKPVVREDAPKSDIATLKENRISSRDGTVGVINNIKQSYNTTFTAQSASRLPGLGLHTSATASCAPTFTTELTRRIVENPEDADVLKSDPMIIDQPVASKHYLVKSVPTVATKSSVIVNLFEPKVTLGSFKTPHTIDASNEDAVLQVQYRDGGDETAPTYKPSYYDFIKLLTDKANETLKKEYMRLAKVVTLLRFVDKAIGKGDFDLSTFYGKVEIEVGDYEDSKWVIDKEFAKLRIYEQMERLVEWRQHLICEARMRHCHPSTCIVELKDSSFEVKCERVKPDISFIKENEDVFPSYLLPADEDDEEDSGVEVEPSGDTEDEDQREYEEGVDYARFEDEGLGDMY